MKTVCVLMSTYNGEKFIETQIKSVLAQKDVIVKLLIRDDGSSDRTVPIIQEYVSKHEEISFYSDKNLGPAKSFLHLLKSAPKADYYSFCDQDDYWEETKLISAVRKIEEKEGPKSETPVMYHSNLKIVDQELKFIRMAHTKDYSAEKPYASLVENSVTGCTAVMNYALARIINSKTPEELTMHDAWCNIVCSFLGKKIYDSNAYIQYRQHANNAIGMKKASLSSNVKTRVKRIKNSAFQPRMVNATQFYKCFRKELGSEQRREVKKMIEYKKSFLNRLKLLFDFKIKAFSLKEDLKYRILILMGEI